MSTRAEILNGADFEGYEDFCADVVNAIKNHYRVSDPCMNMVARQPGEILSDPDDDKLYHVGGASGYPCDEILQATRSCDVIPEFKGVDFYDVCNGDYTRIKAVDEPGLGHRLTIGLDETTRTMVICDITDVDVDFGLIASGQPKLIIMGEGGFVQNYRTVIDRTGVTSYGANPYVHITQYRQWFRFFSDIASSHAFQFYSEANIELTDDNAEQAFMYLEPKINQTLTAGYVAVLVNVTEASLGDASGGAGYNALMDLRVGGTTQFGIQNDGKIMTNQVNICSGATPGTLNGELPIYDGDGNLMGYTPIYSSIC